MNTAVITEFTRKPLVISISIHFIFLLIILILILMQGKKNISRKISFTVIQQYKTNTLSRPIDHKTLYQPIAKKLETKKPRAVFGINRNALITTANNVSDISVNIKMGNTLSKDQDQEKLNNNDPTSLPSPLDEFLVTSMPVLISEVRIPYPKQAREANIEGPVVMELLIDAEGAVRNVTLISGPGFGLNEAAITAVRGVKFKPAKLEQQSVAVKIRYTYRFILETR